jgi:hypothetical protein
MTEKNYPSGSVYPNIWFQGGGYACIWSFGVAQSIKESKFNFSNVGGYSAGALVATFLCNPHTSVENCLDSCFDGPYGPKKSIFAPIGRHQRNMTYMAEACAGHPHDWNCNFYNQKLWIPIRGLMSFTGSWRSQYRNYDDLVDVVVSSGCIPGMSGEFSSCYYQDNSEKRGPTIDGGLFSSTPPEFWKGDTIIVSPWGSGDINMNPSARFLDVIIPRIDKLWMYYQLGVTQGRKFFSS